MDRLVYPVPVDPAQKVQAAVQKALVQRAAALLKVLVLQRFGAVPVDPAPKVLVVLVNQVLVAPEVLFQVLKVQ